MNKSNYEFVFDKSTKHSVELEIQYEQVDNGSKKYQTIISLPFSTKSSFTKTEYKEKEKRAFFVLNSALKSKYNIIKIRDFNNQKRYKIFKNFVSITDEKELKHEYSYGINHRESNDKIGDKSVSEIWEKLNKFMKVTLLADIKENSDSKFKLTWEKLITMLVSDDCAYCGISMKQINELSANGKLFTKRSRGYSLEVDQVDPYGNYKDGNCVACCYWCNNAKTDEFTIHEFKEIAKGINSTWKNRGADIIDFEKIEFWIEMKNNELN